MTHTQIHSVTFLQSIRRGIIKHITLSNTHLSSISLSTTVSSTTQPLYIKIETVYFILKRSLPWIVFEEIMIFLQRIIEHYRCDEHSNCLDIGDKQHSVKEARRIVGVFQDVIHKQVISIIQSPSYSESKIYIVYFSISIDGWSRS